MEDNRSLNEKSATRTVTGAAEAAEYTEKLREELVDGEVGVEHPHDVHEIEDEKVPRLSVLQILRYIGIGVIILVMVLIFYRIHTQKEDYSDYLVWTEEAVAAYQEKGSLTVWTQEMKSFNLTLERDENNMPTRTYHYTYDPYSKSPYEDESTNLEAERLTYKGCFMVGDPMYIEETRQFLITFRVNRTAGDRVKDHYHLDTAPKGDIFRFALSDGGKTYTDYSYVTVEKNTYFYYRLVFNNVDYGYLDYTKLTESDIRELTLSVFYNDKFNPDSPFEVLGCANNVIPGDHFKLKKALPAEIDTGIKKSLPWDAE